MTTLLLGDCAFTPCGDGVAKYLKPADTLAFLEKAKNILGWEDQR
jgi:hypothetical protein